MFKEKVYTPRNKQESDEVNEKIYVKKTGTETKSIMTIRLAVALLENLAATDKISPRTLRAVHRDADKMIAESKALGYNYYGSQLQEGT